jgi:pimeloyl-ACP methyl ester carboxylesterase
MITSQHWVPNGAGHRLALFQSYDPDKLVPGRNPVLIVPGYGMNSFIFSFHPGGLSLEGYLVSQGFEVWRADLRDQGASRSEGAGDRYSLEDLAMVDLGVVIDAVADRARSGAGKVDVIGCSLGGSLMFTHAVLNPRHRMASMVSMGSPVRWVSVNPLVKLAFASPALAGSLPVKGTRRMAELALPVLARHTPWLLSIYMNPKMTDIGAVSELVRTVEDPNRHINREIARWIGRRDLIIRGVNIAEALPGIDTPVLCILASQDGVVPRDTAAFPYFQVKSRHKRLLEVGVKGAAMAHADLFVSRGVQESVFAPLASWLAEHGVVRG